MAQAPHSFTDMFRNLGEQLKLPQIDVAKIMQHHQKNIDAMARSWQAMASGAGEIAKKGVKPILGCEVYVAPGDQHLIVSKTARADGRTRGWGCSHGRHLARRDCPRDSRV